MLSVDGLHQRRIQPCSASLAEQGPHKRSPSAREPSKATFLAFCVILWRVATYKSLFSAERNFLVCMNVCPILRLYFLSVRLSVFFLLSVHALQPCDVLRN